MAVVNPQQELERLKTAPNTAPSHQPAPESKPIIRTRQHKVGLSLTEILTYGGLVLIIVISLLFVLSLKSNSFDMQSEKTSVENEIYVKQGEITELQTEVNALASYERIYDKAAELGLSMNNRNIRVVEKNE